MLALLLALMGCPAEQLGIPVPATGVDAVSMEDLRRDLHALTTGAAASPGPSGREARQRFVDERWRQMGLEVEGSCGHRAGVTEARIAVVSQPAPAGDRQGWAATALAITLAKAVHGLPTQRLGAAFCVGEAPPARWTLHLGRLGVGDDRWEPVVWEEVEVAAHVAGLRVEQVEPDDGDPDLRRLEELAQRLVPVIQEQLTGAPMGPTGVHSLLEQGRSW